ncbi:MAG: hypothetical protein M1814_001816 [Vezdaea aestivalis]|nr:MAG: hypothetical protein M1814_001816 [Vezdaea aestivalis]
MSSYSFPQGDSSPPSTPGTAQAGEHPSTTPAGPPPTLFSGLTPQQPLPTFDLSSTPAGPPPASIFSNSTFQSGGIFGNPSTSGSKPASNVASTINFASFNKPPSTSSAKTNKRVAFGSKASTQPAVFGSATPNKPGSFSNLPLTEGSNAPISFGPTSSTNPPLFGSADANKAPIFGVASPGKSSLFETADPNKAPVFGTSSSGTPGLFKAAGLDKPPVVGTSFANTTGLFGASSSNKPSLSAAPTSSKPAIFGAPTPNNPPALASISRNKGPIFNFSGSDNGSNNSAPFSFTAGSDNGSAKSTPFTFTAPVPPPSAGPFGTKVPTVIDDAMEDNDDKSEDSESEHDRKKSDDGKDEGEIEDDDGSRDDSNDDEEEDIDDDEEDVPMKDLGIKPAPKPSLASRITRESPDADDSAQSTDAASIDLISSFTRPVQQHDDQLDDSSESSILKEPVDSTVAPIARGLAANSEAPDINEPGDLILGSEAIMEKLYGHSDVFEDTHKVGAELDSAAAKLSQLWDRVHFDLRNDFSLNGDALSTDILEMDNCPPVISAFTIARVLLFLHHRPPMRSRDSTLRSSGRYSQSFSPQELAMQHVPYPKVLMEWLNANHNNLSPVLRDVKNARPSSTSHSSFWEVVHGALLRGYFGEAIVLLKNADFSVARTSLEDNSEHVGYQGQTLLDIKKVIAQAIETLEKCPAHRSRDWDVRGHDWTIFRRQIESALDNLLVFAEGHNRDDEDQSRPGMVAPHFGIAKPKDAKFSMSQTSRRLQSKIPWSIYQSLREVYEIILGKSETIVRITQDWLEATICVTAWWPGDPTEHGIGDSLFDDNIPGRNDASEKEKRDYLRQLSTSFAKVTDTSRDTGHEIRTVNSIEVLLGCIFEGKIQEVINVLRVWSLPVAAAITDISVLGGWFPAHVSTGIMDAFDDEDLMVLSTAPVLRTSLSSDDILMSYAEGLFHRPQLSPGREAWEVGVHVLGRLQNEKKANEKLEELLGNIVLNSREKVDKLLHLCGTEGLTDQARKVSERYANSLAQDTDDYGTVITYLARAHADKKVKGVLDLLISYSLIQSRAYPPTEDLDSFLKKMLESPREILTDLSNVDPDAASIISTYLSGYATLRKFYDLRDASIFKKAEAARTDKQIKKMKLKALDALVAVINSSSDNIQGGLYDPESLAVVSVDGLVNLLGESLPLLKGTQKLLTLKQSIALQTAMVHLDMVSPLVRKQTEEHLASSMASYNAEQTSSRPSFSPKASLRKSVSSLTMLAGSEFELVGSELLNSGMGASGVLVPEVPKGAKKVPRGWDWRQGLPRNASVDDVFRILRLELIDEMPTPPPTGPNSGISAPRRQAEARAALTASLSSAGAQMTSDLQSRASNIHNNAAVLSAQNEEVARSTARLAQQTDQLTALADRSAAKLKEIGHVQNWAEMLERDMLVLEDTVRRVEEEREGSNGKRGQGGKGVANGVET